MSANPHNRPTPLSSARIEAALAALDARLARRGIRARINIVGGTAMLVAHQARPFTEDVDAWIIPDNVIQDLILDVARSEGLPDKWLNEDAVAYIPKPARWRAWRTWSHLEVCVADPETLLAMKCFALRNPKDESDVRFLCRHLDLRTPEEAIAIAERMYAPERLDALKVMRLRRCFDAG